jgi:hypothetical protein
MASLLLAVVLYGVGGSGTGREGATQDDGAPPDVGQVEWASQVKARHEHTFFRVPGVVGTGIGRAPDTGEVVIQVYVVVLDDRIREAIPDPVEGIRVQVIESGEFTTR